MAERKGEGKICKGCDTFKSWDRFYAGNNWRCKDCLREFDRKRKQAVPPSPCVLDPELVKQFGRKI